MAGKRIECWEGASRARRSSEFAVIEDSVKSPGALVCDEPQVKRRKKRSRCNAGSGRCGEGRSLVAAALAG